MDTRNLESLSNAQRRALAVMLKDQVDGCLTPMGGVSANATFVCRTTVNVLKRKRLVKSTMGRYDNGDMEECAELTVRGYAVAEIINLVRGVKGQK